MPRRQENRTDTRKRHLNSASSVRNGSNQTAVTVHVSLDGQESFVTGGRRSTQFRLLGRCAFDPRPAPAPIVAGITKSAPSSPPGKPQLPCFQLQRRTVSGHGKQRRLESQGLTRNAKEV